MDNINQKLSLRKATSNDIDLLKLWDQQSHVIESDPNEDWDWEVELSHEPFWRQQLVAEVNEKAIAFIQIIDPYHEETHYWGDVQKNLRAIDIWIGEENYLNKGYGTEMMNQAINICFNQAEVSAIVIDPLASNAKAHRFYERLGFKFVEERWFGKDLTFVYRLDKINFKNIK